MGRVAQSVQRLATGWTVRESIPVGARFSAPVQTGPGAHPASCTMGTGSFPGVKSGRGVTLTPHLLLVPWSKKSRAIPLLPLWAVRPVQSLSACTRVHLTFYHFRESSVFPLVYFCHFLILPHIYFPGRNSLVTRLFLLPSQNSRFIVISLCDLTQRTSPTNFTLPHTHNVGAINISMTISS